MRERDERERELLSTVDRDTELRQRLMMMARTEWTRSCGRQAADSAGTIMSRHNGTCRVGGLAADSELKPVSKSGCPSRSLARCQCRMDCPGLLDVTSMQLEKASVGELVGSGRVEHSGVGGYIQQKPNSLAQ